MIKQTRFVSILIIAILFMIIALITFAFGSTRYHMIEGIIVGIVSIGFFIAVFSLKRREK